MIQTNKKIEEDIDLFKNFIIFLIGLFEFFKRNWRNLYLFG